MWSQVDLEDDFDPDEYRYLEDYEEEDEEPKEKIMTID